MLDKKIVDMLDGLFEGAYIVDPNRQIVYWNHGCERITGFKKEEVVNKFCYNNILQHVDTNGVNLCHNGCPLLKTIQTGNPSENDVFLHHKYGHRVPITVRTTPLYDEQGQIIGALEVFTDKVNKKDIARENRKLKKLVITDPLTGGYNRRFLDFQLSTKVSQAVNFNQSFGIIFIDIDKFKDVNDTFGHDAGDEVLKVVANTISSNIRLSDLFGRWGGEEFIVIADASTNEDLKVFSEKLRVLVEKSSITYNNELIRITISLGATIYKKDDTETTIVSRADKAMYNAKQTGRNKVTIY